MISFQAPLKCLILICSQQTQQGLQSLESVQKTNNKIQKNIDEQMEIG